MKTIKLIALAIFSLTVLNSCTDENPKWHTENIEILGRDWRLVGNGNEIGSYYEYIFPGFPYVDGIINVYLYQNYNTNNEIQIPLPYTEYGIYFDEKGEEKHFSTQYSYDIAIDGSIAFKVHYSDYYTGEFRPGTEYFRVAIVY